MTALLLRYTSSLVIAGLIAAVSPAYAAAPGDSDPAATMPDVLKRIERCPDPVTEACLARIAPKLERALKDPAVRAWSAKAAMIERGKHPCLGLSPAELVSDYNAHAAREAGAAAPVITATDAFNLHSTANDPGLVIDGNIPQPACAGWMHLDIAGSGLNVPMIFYFDAQAQEMAFSPIRTF